MTWSIIYNLSQIYKYPVNIYPDSLVDLQVDRNLHEKQGQYVRSQPLISLVITSVNNTVQRKIAIIM